MYADGEAGEHGCQNSMVSTPLPDATNAALLCELFSFMQLLTKF
jgi:hypothetical protein